MVPQRPPEDTITAQNMARTADNTYNMKADLDEMVQQLTALQNSFNTANAELVTIDNNLSTINSTIGIECGKILDAINAQGQAIVAAINANGIK